MKGRAERAVERFAGDLCCSQSVISLFGPELGLDADTAVRIATPFCGGMGRKGKTCGAVTGALMTIGLRYGPTHGTDAEAKDRALELARRFMAAFEARHGSVECRDILGVDIGTPEGCAEACARDLYVTRCRGFVRDAVEILEGLL